MTNLRWGARVLSLAVILVGSSAVGAAADPVANPTSVSITAVCSNGQTYAFLVSPASGSAVLDTASTTVQVTFSLTVNDPLNEFGGSFSVPLRAKIPASKLTNCSGAVIGTQAVTYTAQVLVTPAT
jgi:hypothetical protein